MDVIEEKKKRPVQFSIKSKSLQHLNETRIFLQLLRYRDGYITCQQAKHHKVS